MQTFIFRKYAFWILFLILGFKAHAQKLPQSPAFKALKSKIEKQNNNIEKLDSTLADANKLVKIAKNNFEKGVALYVKANVIMYSSSDLRSGDLALPFIIESTRILSQEKDDEYYHLALGFLSVCYDKIYYKNGLNYPLSKKSAYYTNLALQVQTTPGYRPEVDFSSKYLDKPASKDELKEVIKNTEQNLQFWVKKGSVPHKMWRNQTLGRLYWYVTGDYGSSENYLNKAILYADTCKDLEFRYVILNTLSSLAIEAKEYKKAIYYGELNLIDLKKSKNEIHESIIQDQLYLAYKYLGKNEEAFRHKERSFAINEKYYRETEKLRSKLLRERNQVLESKMQLQNELDRQRNVRLWLGIVIALLLMAIAAGLYYNRNLIQKNKEISAALLQGQTIERKRVAMDLHDNLGSTLSALWMSIDTVDQSKMNKKEKEIHNTLRENLEKAYNDVRLLSHNLLPDEFEKKGLVAALENLVRNLNKNSKVIFSLDIPEDLVNLEKNVEFELYSICLELTNNILKHANATEGRINISQHKESLTLLVSDNGSGVLDVESSGKGLQNVKARIEAIKGKLINKTLAWNIV